MAALASSTRARVHLGGDFGALHGDELSGGLDAFLYDEGLDGLNRHRCRLRGDLRRLLAAAGQGEGRQ